MSSGFPNVYHLANRAMSLIVSRGAFHSIKLDSQTVEFVLPGQAFTQVEWHVAGAHSYQSITADHVRSESATASEYMMNAEVASVEVDVNLRLHERHIELVYTLKNNTADTVELDGLRFHLPCNTEFKWGDPAGEKVLPHAYIGGHGSHVIYNRCDGVGSSLVLFPQGDTLLEYYDLGDDTDERYNNTHRSVLAVYPLSAERKKSHEQAESKMPFTGSSLTLEPAAEKQFSFHFVVAENRAEVRSSIIRHGLAHLDIIPGLTVAKDQEIRMAVHTLAGPYTLVNHKTNEAVSFDSELTASADTASSIVTFSLSDYGEQAIDLVFEDKRYMTVTFYVTETVENLIKKRAAFIAESQVRDPSLWYDGLLCEYNNNTGVLLTPDEYDDIEGWRRYAVTCDDPGLSKPAFLSSKQRVWPEQNEVEALDYYLDRFVWGGLQMTTEELYPYAIYGIIDWKQLRDSADPDIAGRSHVWRIYDYPHIYLTYFNLYFVAKHYPDIRTAHSADVYLEKAYRTALAMFTIPAELAAWSAFETGLYNELAINDIIRALENEDRTNEALRLQRLWDRKATSFISAKKDIFGSEYPFDTTGFESTQVLANRAIELAVAEQTTDPQARVHHISPHDAERFMHVQADANLATRGLFEPAYYWYGSDYRGNNYKYTLSYMSQMGGQALLEYALHNTASHEEAAEILRYAYGSLLSSWALLHQNGTASGGFEPLPYGQTWLGPKHQFGPWYYSCEIDLGFCGGLRGMSTVIAEDPILGVTVYGGRLCQDGEKLEVIAADGVLDQLHVLTEAYRLSLSLDVLQLSSIQPIRLSQDRSELIVPCIGRPASQVRADDVEQLYRIRMTGEKQFTVTVDELTDGFELRIKIH